MNHQPKKKFGQNFLKDKNLLKKIVSESHVDQKNVIEVGPGQGALTSFLASTAKQVVAYEIDTSLKPYLTPLEIKHPNLKVIYEDFLESDLSGLEETYHVVANVPYYITTPILFKILENKKIASASLMIQKEVCDRLLAKPNQKAYNALSVILQYQTHASKMMDVKRHMFYPVPNVDSAVIRIVKHDQALLDLATETRLLKLVKEAFRQKRKTLVNNLHQGFGIPKDVIESLLTSLGYQTQIRAEALSLDDFMHIAKVWSYD